MHKPPMNAHKAIIQLERCITEKNKLINKIIVVLFLIFFTIISYKAYCATKVSRNGAKHTININLYNNDFDSINKFSVLTEPIKFLLIQSNKIEFVIKKDRDNKK